MQLNPPLHKAKDLKYNFMLFDRYCKESIVLIPEVTKDLVKQQLLYFSLSSTIEKVSLLLYKNLHCFPDKILTIKFNYAERITLSIIFKHLPIQEPALTNLENQILNQLTYGNIYDYSHHYGQRPCVI